MRKALLTIAHVTRFAPANEDSLPVACLIVVNRSAEVLDMATGETVAVEPDARRASLFRAVADHRLEAAYGLAYAILRDRTEAEDATHDAFLRAWDSFRSLRDTNRFDAWFDRILVNVCRNRLRDRSRWRPRDISAGMSLRASGDEVGRTQDRDLLQRSIERLSPDHQVIVALRYYRDLPMEEIARRVGVPVGTVHSRLHYALKRLQTDLAEAEIAGGER